MTSCLTLEEVARELKIHRETIRRYVREGKMKAIKLDRVWRVEEKDFRDFLDQRKVTGMKRD